MRAAPRAVIASLSERHACVFPGSRRLHAAAEFSAVFAGRKVLRGRNFELLYLAAGAAGSTAGAKAARLGLIVAKRFARSAVLRNLVKRLAREAFRQKPMLASSDVVLRLARPLDGADRTRRLAWRAEIDGLLKRLDDELRK